MGRRLPIAASLRIRTLSLLTSLTVGLLTCVPAAFVAEAASERKIYFYHPDHLGSTALVTDEQGQVVERAEYTPYGSTSVREGPVNVPHKFTGQRQDSTTGLYYYHARYYDPTLGRFIQPDSIVPDPANPQALNRYSYVQNNPLTFTDPSGHKRRGFFRAFFAAVAAVFVTIATAGHIEAGIATFVSLAASTVGAVVGDQVGRGLDRAASSTSAAAATSVAGATPAALLGSMLPTSTSPMPTPTPRGDSWPGLGPIIVGDVFPGPETAPPGDRTLDTPWSGPIIDAKLPEIPEPLYNALKTSKTPKPTNEENEEQGSTINNRTPVRGKPNTQVAFPDGKGGKTIRIYGPDGLALRDIDYGHGEHGAGTPHVHDWDWGQPRGKTRGPGRPPRKGEKL